MSNETAQLIKMINQIAENIGPNDSEEENIAKVANHIKLFWARPMLEKVCAKDKALQDQLSPIAQKAADLVRAELFPVK